MPFMVIHRTAGGVDHYEQTDALDEAALHAERLRNSEGIDDVRLFRLEEISFSFRPYYKVELGMPDRQAPAPGAPVDPVAEAEVADVANVTDAATAASAGEGVEAEPRRGLFGR